MNKLEVCARSSNAGERRGKDTGRSKTEIPTTLKHTSDITCLRV